jgi:peptide chain release factor 1
VLERVEELERELAEVEARLADPATIADRERYVAEARRFKELGAVVDCGRRLRARHDDLEVARELDMVAEAAEAEVDVETLTQELRLLLLPQDPNDDKDVIVEIRGAEGGEEANLFARDLFEMYRGYAAAKGWKVDVLGRQPSDMGGFSEIAFTVSGDGVWTHLKHEGGPHRVQRVPVTESQGRVHTSSATVSVLPEAEEVDIDIDPNDLQIDVYRSSGPGGQSVNTTDSAVRVTHRPTGLVVSMQDEKSQLQNRAKAMRVLRSRLLKAEQDRRNEEASTRRKDQIGGGGRSEKIRTYNFKESRVSDHRINLTLYRLDQILAGDLDPVVEPLMQDERARQLQEP